MLNEEDPVHAAIRLEELPAGPRPGLPSPRLTFTGRFRAGKAPEVLVGGARPACRAAAGLPAAAARSKSADHLPPPGISFRGPQALKVRTGMSVR
jgi:hypothetical protein